MNLIEIQKFSVLTSMVRIKGDKNEKDYILKNYDKEFNNFCIYNELIYFYFADLILKKAGIKNTIPKRTKLSPGIILENANKKTEILNYSCLIEYKGSHFRITKENEYKIQGDFPHWIYFIDIWLGRLDCDGDTNLICTQEGKIIPIDFNLICTWSEVNHPYYQDYSIFNFVHFDRISKNKEYKIAKIIKELKKKEIEKIIFMCDINHKIIAHKKKEKYIEGLLYRKKKILIP
jgi:hypothetical protein